MTNKGCFYTIWIIATDDRLMTETCCGVFKIVKRKLGPRPLNRKIRGFLLLAPDRKRLIISYVFRPVNRGVFLGYVMFINPFVYAGLCLWFAPYFLIHIMSSDF